MAWIQRFKGLNFKPQPIQVMKEGGNDIIRIIAAIFLPPVGVALQVGLGAQFWINLLLTMLGFIPGIIHALYIILTRGPSQPATSL